MRIVSEYGPVICGPGRPPTSTANNVIVRIGTAMTGVRRPSNFVLDHYDSSKGRCVRCSQEFPRRPWKLLEELNRGFARRAETWSCFTLDEREHSRRDWVTAKLSQSRCAPTQPRHTHVWVGRAFGRSTAVERPVAGHVRRVGVTAGHAQPFHRIIGSVPVGFSLHQLDLGGPSLSLQGAVSRRRRHAPFDRPRRALRLVGPPPPTASGPGTAYRSAQNGPLDRASRTPPVPQRH
ncbi:hypothetical protein DSM43518_05630 [Mycobacterium marinum]|nr:hypothetical protein DSM43518_05630 [Mycobacterium marinum]